MADITIRLNGENVQISENTSLSDIVAQYELPTVGVAIEVSTHIVPRSKWGETILKSEDQVEIVSMVGGG